MGSADAIYQSLNLVADADPDYVLVFGADHVYRMDPQQMLDEHIASGAGVTVAGIRVPRSQASSFGIIETAANGTTIARFHEKPTEAPTIPGSPDECFASMGNYIFTRKVLEEILREDASDSASIHDMGTNVIPLLSERGQAHVYDFARNQVPGATQRDQGYWRDVGTLDSYHEAHMDLVSVHPIFNLYNTEWPILTTLPPLAPAKFVQGGSAQDSVVGAGSIIAGSHVRQSVVAHDVMIADGAYVDGAVLMPGVRIGRGAVVRRAILDKNAFVGEGVQIGVDLERDRQHYTVSDSGIVVLGKSQEAVR
jgi:glucose-1-phosphate adenylyltransferase